MHELKSSPRAITLDSPKRARRPTRKTRPARPKAETNQAWLNSREPRSWTSCSVELRFEGELPSGVRKSLGSSQGSIALMQSGREIGGVLILGGAKLAVDGQLHLGPRGSRCVRFTARGTVQPFDVSIAFTGVLDGSALSGRFVMACSGIPAAFPGALFCDDMLRKEAPGAVPKEDKDPGCGKKLWGPGTQNRTIRQGPPKVVTHWRITAYEKCTIIEQLDDEGNAIPGSVDKLPKTNGDDIGGGRKVTGYGGNTAGTVEKVHKEGAAGAAGWLKADLKKWGHWIILVLSGCDDPTFFQFIDAVTSLTGESDKKDEGWQPDPPPKGTAYPGTFDTGDGSKGFIDMPGPEGTTSGKPCPKDKTIKSGSGPDVVKPLEDGDVFTLHESFETFICCGGTLLGYYTWDCTLTFTYKVGPGWSDPVTTDGGAPAWHPDPKTVRGPETSPARPSSCAVFRRGNAGPGLRF